MDDNHTSERCNTLNLEAGHNFHAVMFNNMGGSMKNKNKVWMEGHFWQLGVDGCSDFFFNLK